MPLVATVQAPPGPWRASRSRPKGPRAGQGDRGVGQIICPTRPRASRALQLLEVSFRGMECDEQNRRCQFGVCGRASGHAVGLIGRLAHPKASERFRSLCAWCGRRRSPRQEAGHVGRKVEECRNGTGSDAVCSGPRPTSATCASLYAFSRRHLVDPDGCAGRRTMKVQECVMDRFRAKTTLFRVSCINH